MRVAPSARLFLGAIILVMATIFALRLQFSAIDGLWEQDLQRTAANLKELASTNLPESGPPIGDSELAGLLDIPLVTGIAVFSEHGRQVWSRGESLELLAYQLNRNDPLTHHADEAARIELFWPASHLPGAYGAAIRIDAAWRADARRQMMVTAGGAMLLVMAATALVILLLGPRQAESGHRQTPRRARPDKSAGK